MSNKDLIPLEILTKFGNFFKKNDSKLNEEISYESKFFLILNFVDYLNNFIFTKTFFQMVITI